MACCYYHEYRPLLDQPCSKGRRHGWVSKRDHHQRSKGWMDVQQGCHRDGWLQGIHYPHATCDYIFLNCLSEKKKEESRATRAPPIWCKPSGSIKGLSQTSKPRIKYLLKGDLRENFILSCRCSFTSRCSFCSPSSSTTYNITTIRQYDNTLYTPEATSIATPLVYKT